MAPILGRVSVGDGEWESDSVLELERLIPPVVDSAARERRDGQRQRYKESDNNYYT